MDPAAVFPAAPRGEGEEAGTTSQEVAVRVAVRRCDDGASNGREAKVRPEARWAWRWAARETREEAQRSEVKSNKIMRSSTEKRRRKADQCGLSEVKGRGNKWGGGQQLQMLQRDEGTRRLSGARYPGDTRCLRLSVGSRGRAQGRRLRKVRKGQTGQCDPGVGRVQTGA